MNNDKNLQNVDTFPDDKELKEVTIKGKLSKYELGLKKMIAGIVLMSVAGVAYPIAGSYMFNDPSLLNMAIVTVPLTGSCAVFLSKRLKEYFALKKEAEKELEDDGKGKSL